jgi:outer membrane protein
VKNLSLVLNLVLLIAVAHLYYLNIKNQTYSSLHADSSLIDEVSDNEESEERSNSSANILYINTDSLWKDYSYVKQAQEDLRLEKMKLEGQFKTKLDAFEKDYMDLQQRASKGLLSMEEGQKKEAELMQRQQDLMGLKEDLAIKLMEKEQDMNDKIQDAIYDFIKQYKKDKDIDFILGYTNGGGAVLYGNSNLEITKDIVLGLNKRYEEAKTEKANKK